jgi:hypothetical protein
LAAVLLVSPLLVWLAWQLVWQYAEEHGGPAGDTLFAWMPLLPFLGNAALFVGFAVLAVLVLVIAGQPMFRFAAWTGLVLVAADLVILYGLTFASMVSREGFPSRLDVAVLLGVAAVVSIAPMVWVWWLSTRAANSATGIGRANRNP